MTTQTHIIEACAEAAHEANRLYCASIGDRSQAPWDEAPDWQKDSCRKGVVGALAGNTPEQSHESWLAEKRAAGWVYGPTKDPHAKTHPCVVPYAELPQEQLAKDAIFVSVVRAVAARLQVHDNTVGEIAHAGYLASTGGKTFDGAEAPRWAQLTTAIRCAWEVFAARVRHATEGESVEQRCAAGYACYSAAVGGKRWNGEPIPVWGEIGSTQEHWLAAARDVVFGGRGVASGDKG